MFIHNPSHTAWRRGPWQRANRLSFWTTDWQASSLKQALRKADVHLLEYSALFSGRLVRPLGSCNPTLGKLLELHMLRTVRAMICSLPRLQREVLQCKPTQYRKANRAAKSLTVQIRSEGFAPYLCRRAYNYCLYHTWVRTPIQIFFSCSGVINLPVIRT